jgi:hypothetical protein
LEFFFVTLSPSLQLKAVPFPAAQFLGQDPVGVFFSSFLLFFTSVMRAHSFGHLLQQFSAKCLVS